MACGACMMLSLNRVALLFMFYIVTHKLSFGCVIEYVDRKLNGYEDLFMCLESFKNKCTQAWSSVAFQWLKHSDNVMHGFFEFLLLFFFAVKLGYDILYFEYIINVILKKCTTSSIQLYFEYTIAPEAD